MYPPFVEILAMLIVVFAIAGSLRSKGRGWDIALMLSSFVLGSSGPISEFATWVVSLPLNWLYTFAYGGVLAEGIIVLVSGAGLVLTWKFGNGKKWEPWAQLLCGIVFGTSSVITSWMPNVMSMLNEQLMALA